MSDVVEDCGVGRFRRTMKKGDLSQVYSSSTDKGYMRIVNRP
jgi:hypothetical protein